MRILSTRKLFLPALSIVAGVLLLLALFGVSTYRNLDRQKAAALEALRTKGMVLLEALEAGARTGMMMPEWNEDSVETLIREICRNEVIAYIYLIGSDGNVAHAGGATPPSGVNFPPLSAENAHQVIEQTRTLPDGTSVYELARRFHPYPELPRSNQSGRMMLTPHGEAFAHSHKEDLLVIGLKMTAFSEARRADLLHAFMMAGVLLLLGSAALFFIIVIQNYYLVNKAFDQTKDYTRQVLASLPNGLIGINAAGRITSYNHQALEMLGMNDNRMKEANLDDIIDIHSNGIESALNQRLMIQDKEILHQRHSGERIPLAISISSIRGENGSASGAVIMLRDLTEIKRLETNLRRAEKLAAIGQLAARMAHEIRNPLSSIRGFAQFLNHSLKNRPQEQDYAATMVAEVDRINRVVSDLLSLSRPVEVKPVECSVYDLVRHVIRLVADEAGAKRVALHLEVAAEFAPCRVDPNQITQALLNLALNSLQAVEPGGAVRIGAALDRSGELKLWVSDNGHGIPLEHQNQVFDPFFTTRSHGTGLGLAIVQQIVESHNGEIAVESPIAGNTRGCRFTIRIPTAAHVILTDVAILDT
jgi:two-component system sensor histidine kinase HydH